MQTKIGRAPNTLSISSAVSGHRIFSFRGEISFEVLSIWGYFRDFGTAFNFNFTMIPNQVVRYFYYLGYALGKYGHTPFPTFKDGIINFYSAYIRHKYYLSKPLHYPSTYGLN